jgi:hypothetical protein
MPTIFEQIFDNLLSTGKFVHFLYGWPVRMGVETSSLTKGSRMDTDWRLEHETGMEEREPGNQLSPRFKRIDTGDDSSGEKNMDPVF